MTNDLSGLDVFHGELSANRAVVYVRLPRVGDDAGLSLSGQVRGPRCLVAETLPATFPLVDLGPGPTLLAQAIVPEPCLWSADLPAIYDVTITLKRGSDIVATTLREIGLRGLGVRGRHLAVAGKRWVLRGVCEPSAAAALPRAWHDAAAAYVAEGIYDERLIEASQWGALACVRFEGAPDEIVERLRQLARYPAAAVAVVSGDLPLDFKPAVIAPNLLIVQSVTSRDGTVQPWANLLWADASEPAALEKWLALTELPIVAVRRLASRLPLDQARAACDLLQRDLASVGQFAGYVV